MNKEHIELDFLISAIHDGEYISTENVLGWI